jgi:hypothetical protein
MVPSTILFISSDAVTTASQFWIANIDSFPEFDQWWHLRMSGIAIDFRRI